MTLGEYIRLYRAEHGLSQREFVERCGGGITHGYISIIEKGVNPNTGKASRPSLDKLYAIARGMGMSMSDLAKKVDDFGDAASIVTESTMPPRPMNALPYTPSRSMVAVVGSVRCGPGGALAYTDLQGAEMADVSDPSEYFYLRAVYVHPDHLEITFSFEDGDDRPPARVELGEGVCIKPPGGHQTMLIQTLARVGRVFVISVNRPR